MLGFDHDTSTGSSWSAIRRFNSARVLAGIMTSIFWLTGLARVQFINSQAEAVRGGQGQGAAFKFGIHTGQDRAAILRKQRQRRPGRWPGAGLRLQCWC